MNKTIKILISLLLVGLIMAAIAGYTILLKPNFNASKDGYFYIKTSDSYGDVLYNLKSQGLVISFTTFSLLADQVDLESHYKPGRYPINEDMSNLDLVRKLRSGNWTKVVLKLKSELSRDSLTRFLAVQTQANNKALDSLLSSNYPDSFGFTKENIYSIFLPDHYFFNWAITEQGILKRFIYEYEKFWTSARDSQAKEIGLSREEVCTLASIVDGEAIHTSEMPIIAGLYLNRLEKRMPLQADPTIKYLVSDKNVRRILREDLKIESPYNTYLNVGLPPGPIMLPDKKAIDAVLNHNENDYIYMCAKEDGSFYHYFTNSLTQHNKNAALYRRSLNNQNIRR